MSDRVREIVLDEVALVPAREGDLSAVRERARRRHQHRRVAMAAVVVTLIAGAAVAGIGLQQEPQAPVIGTEANGTTFLLQWCSEEMCGERDVSAEAVAQRLDAEPWVRSVRLHSAEDAWEAMVEQLGDEAVENISPDALAPVAEVVVDRHDPVLDIAVELHGAAPGTGVSLGPLPSPEALWGSVSMEGRFDPGAAIGERPRVLAHGERWLDVWRVDGGGVCFELEDMVSCHRNHLLPRTDVSSHDQGGWGVLDDGTSCTWGRTGLESEEVIVRYDDGTEVQAELGRAPDIVLAQVYLACSASGGHPVRLEATSPDGSSSASTDDDGTSIVQRRDG